MIAPNIFRFSGSSLLAWCSAYAIYEPLSYFVIPAILSSETVQEYYNYKKIPFAIVAFGDFIYSTFLLLVAQQVIKHTVGAASSVSMVTWILSFIIFVGVQWVGDISFYSFIQRIPPITKYIDFFQRYTKEVGVGAAIADSIYGIFWFILAQIMASHAPVWLQATLITLFMFVTLAVSY
jgi:hypothetical protein